MEAQAKAIMDLTAAISGMNDMMQTKFNDINAKLDEIQPLARNLQLWRPPMEQAVEDLRSEINDRRAHFYDAVDHGAPDAEADSPSPKPRAADAPSASVARANSYIDARHAIPVDEASSSIVEKDVEDILPVSTGVLCTAPATCSTDFLPEPQMAALVRVAFWESTPIEYGLDTNSIPIAAVPRATWGVFPPVFAPSTQLQQPYKGSELLRPGSSQRITSMVPVAVTPLALPVVFPTVPAPAIFMSTVKLELLYHDNKLVMASDTQCTTSKFPIHRPIPWPSFMVIPADGDGTRPLPWPSFNEVNDVLFPESPPVVSIILQVAASLENDNAAADLNLHAVCIELMGTIEQPNYRAADSCEAGTCLFFVSSPIGRVCCSDSRLFQFVQHLVQQLWRTDSSSQEDSLITVRGHTYHEADLVTVSSSWDSHVLVQLLSNTLLGDCFLVNSYGSDIPSIDRLYLCNKMGFQVSTASIFNEAMLELQLTTSGNSGVCLHKLDLTRSGTEGTVPRKVSLIMHIGRLQCEEAILACSVSCPSVSSSGCSVGEGQKLELNNWVSYTVAQYTDQCSMGMKTEFHSFGESTSRSLMQAAGILLLLLYQGDIPRVCDGVMCRCGWYQNQDSIHNLANSEKMAYADHVWLSYGFVQMCVLEEQLLPTWPPPIASCLIIYSRSRNTELPSLVNWVLWPLKHQDVMQTQIVWQPSVHACFITIEQSYEDNESRCCLYLYHGGRCAMFSTTSYIALDNYMDYLDSLSSNGLKVVQVPWDPGVCSASISPGLRASRMLRRGECHGPCGPTYYVTWAVAGRRPEAQGMRAEGGNQLYLKGGEDEQKGVEELEPETENPGKGGDSFFLPVLCISSLPH